MLLEAEKDIDRGRNRLAELFTVPRNRRATQASFIVMFMLVGSLASNVTSDRSAGNNCGCGVKILLSFTDILSAAE